MNINDAMQVIRDPQADWWNKVEATDYLAQTEETPLDCLLECLRIKGIPAETAAVRLYLRTGRTREDVSIQSFIVDYDDWRNYLTREGFIEGK